MLCASLDSNERVARMRWRKRVGIEPQQEGDPIHAVQTVQDFTELPPSPEVAGVDPVEGEEGQNEYKPCD
jgi:hypothetical protein